MYEGYLYNIESYRVCMNTKQSVPQITALSSTMQRKKSTKMYNVVVEWFLLPATCDQRASCPPSLNLGIKTRAQLETLIIVIISQD